MRGKERGKWRVLQGVTVLIAAFLAMPVATRAVDTDTDGFSDAIEGGNNTFIFAGPVNSPTVQVRWSKCPTPRTNDNCVAPNKKDLFVYFTSPSAVIPATSRLSIFNGIDNILAHDIPANYVTSKREVAKEGTGIVRQKAVQVIDNTTAPITETLGITSGGTPNTTTPVTIYTNNIVNFLDKTCAGKVCTDNSTNYTYGANLDFRDRFVRHVIAHELGHTVNRVTPLDNVVGAHYRAEDKVVMSQYVYKEYPDSNTVKFFIPTVWTADDKIKARLY